LDGAHNEQRGSASAGRKSMATNEYSCPSCGSLMILRQSPTGDFLACSAYPKCRVARRVDAEGVPIEPPDSGVVCDWCGSPMSIRRGPRGPFLGCSAYPSCKGTKAIDRLD